MITASWETRNEGKVIVLAVLYRSIWNIFFALAHRP